MALDDDPTRQAPDEERGGEMLASRADAAPSSAPSPPQSGSEGDGPHEPDLEDEGEGSLPTLARVGVADGDAVRPFMRGILVHSLTEKGLSFEDAYETAQSVWLRVRQRARVTKGELRELVEALLTARSEGQADGRPDPARPPVPPVLQVLGKDGRWPFNQARLQQPLLAAGLRPLEAFRATLEIESRLLARHSDSVARDVLRDLAAGLLRERFSAGVADRYLSWRAFQSDDERPLILLLGGTSGVGKSSLALEVARRLSIGRVLSTDSIRDVMRVMLSDDLVPTLHVSSFEAHSRLSRPVQDGADPVIEGFLEQSRTVIVGVRAAIERAIAEGTSTVIDGVSLVPGLIDVAE